MTKQRSTVLITGGGRGIGAACARKFFASDFNVVITSRTDAELKQVVEECKNDGENQIVSLKADISKASEVAKVFDYLAEHFGGVDILINNAGTIIAKDFADFSVEDWDLVQSVNTRGAFLCCHHGFKQMMTKKGENKVILNVSSMAAVPGAERFKGFSAYTVSKFGISGLTEALAVEGKEYNIKVLGVAPGAVETDMLAKAAPFLKTNTKPQDIADVIFNLCGETMAQSFSGNVIPIHSTISE